MSPTELDAILQSEYPLHIVGQIAGFTPLAKPGSRFLLTKHGLALEACNGVYHSIEYLALADTEITLPYGEVETGVTTIDPDAAQALRPLINGFLGMAEEAFPKETIMLIVKAPGKPPRTVAPGCNASVARLDYDFSMLEEGEEVIVDIHSHGQFAAGFSTTDDLDDAKYRGHLKTCYVLGNVDREAYTIAQRWVARGHIFSQTTAAQMAKEAAPC